MSNSLLTRLLAALLPVAEAHCDTADGPAVTDGRRALATGELGYALKWIPAEGEAELREVFAQVRAVRDISPQVAGVADRLFLETLVRLHRLGEGVGFTGIQPAGASVAPVIREADLALESGDLGALLAIVPAERRAELQRRFDIARGKRDFVETDVTAGREYIEAYVAFFKYAEGEDDAHHEHCHDQPAAHT